jgi:hypothetical protein
VKILPVTLLRKLVPAFQKPLVTSKVVPKSAWEPERGSTIYRKCFNRSSRNCIFIFLFNKIG